jgi:hypothetical protein
MGTDFQEFVILCLCAFVPIQKDLPLDYQLYWNNKISPPLKRYTRCFLARAHSLYLSLSLSTHTHTHAFDYQLYWNNKITPPLKRLPFSLIFALY